MRMHVVLCNRYVLCNMRRRIHGCHMRRRMHVMLYEEEDACHVMQPRYVLCVHTACMPCMYTCMHVHDEQMYALMQACPLLSMSAHGGPDASMPPFNHAHIPNWVLSCRSRAARQSIFLFNHAHIPLQEDPKLGASLSVT